jgi:hypothetical protein
MAHKYEMAIARILYGLMKPFDITVYGWDKFSLGMARKIQGNAAFEILCLEKP